MLINVSTLLTEPVGHARRYRVEREPLAFASNDDGNGAAQVMSGDLRLIRSERGVIVMASLDVESVSHTCSRCLEPFELPVHVEFDEEYVLDRDPETGERIESEPDEFLIDARRHLDLSEAVRQYEESALPLQPLCREECLGLCPECGQNLNEGACGHGAARVDHRWSGLANLAERLRTEESDGRPEA
jgi:uncharacterized protein